MSTSPLRLAPPPLYAPLVTSLNTSPWIPDEALTWPLSAAGVLLGRCWGPLAHPQGEAGGAKERISGIKWGGSVETTRFDVDLGG